eukprot:3401245-Amphidinium_carterae.1
MKWCPRDRDGTQSRASGAYTRQGAGVSKYTESKAHLLPTLHRLAASRPEPTQQEYTSIQLNRVSELQVHTDRFNHDMNWVVSFGQYTGGRVWIEQPKLALKDDLPLLDFQSRLCAVNTTAPTTNGCASTQRDSTRLKRWLAGE